MNRQVIRGHALLASVLIVSLLCIQWAVPPEIQAQSTNLTLGNFIKLNEKRITRTVYEYTYRADLTNAGPALSNVIATAISKSNNTTLVSATLAFGDISAGSTVTSSNTIVFRHDRLYPFSWSNLTWNFKSSMSVGPEGGTLQFANGVVLMVPPFAVKEHVTITIKDQSLEEATAILQNPSMVSNYPKKRILGGFSAEPDGLVFDVPIQAVIPVQPLEPYGIPILMELLPYEQRYRYVSSLIEYDGTTNMMKSEIRHFTNYITVEITTEITDQQFEESCTDSCDAEFSPVCENFDLLQPACCLIHPKIRQLCFPTPESCQCCREKRIKVEVSDVDVGVNVAEVTCQVASSDIKIVFLDCPHSPTESRSVGDSTCKDLQLEMKIDPPTADIAVGDTFTFTATLTGKLQGKEVVTNMGINPIWKSDAPNIASIDQSGKVKGIAKSTAPVTIRASLGESFAVAATAQVTVLDLTGTWRFTKTGQACNCPFPCGPRVCPNIGCTEDLDIVQSGNSLQEYSSTERLIGQPLGYTKIRTGTLTGKTYEMDLVDYLWWQPFTNANPSHVSGTITSDNTLSETRTWTLNYATPAPDGNGYSYDSCTGSEEFTAAKIE